MVRKLLFFTSLVYFTSCASSIVGSYSTAKKGSAAFAGRAITLNSDSTFLFDQWTDVFTVTKDENGNIKCPDTKTKGKGIYQVAGDTLILHFTNNDFISCAIEIRESKDYFDIHVNCLDEYKRPFRGMTLIVHAKNKQSIASELTNEHGRASLKVAKDQNPQQLSISSFAAENCVIDIEKTVGTNNYPIKRCLGFYEKGAIEKLWYKKRGKYFFYKKNDGQLVRLTSVE